MAENRLVSVIIPVFNGERYLAEAIKSALAQTYKPIEVIVVDDGSMDRSSDVAKGFGAAVQYFFQPNQGVAAARNWGIQLARGNYFAHLDGDDLWVENKIEYQMAAFDQNPHVDIVTGYVQQFYSPELEDPMRERIRFPKEPLPAYVTGAALIKREAFFRVGLFETELQVGTDMSWYLRARDAGLIMMALPHIVLKRRLHQNNKGIVLRHLMPQRLHILKASLDRRRNQRRQ